MPPPPPGSRPAAPPVRSRVEDALRRAIAEGEFAPGSRLVEADLVARFDAGRSHVRLAIDALAAEGLVERVPNRGARVRVVSTEEAVAITECRMALEALIAGKAAERVTDAEAGRLRAQLGAMRDALAAGDLLGYSALIQELHGLLHAAARQPVAAGLVDRLQAQLVRHQFRLSLRPGRPQVSLAELGELVDAVTGRDPGRAAAAATAHFASVIDALAASTGSPGGTP
ncbi:GntR family transcriptional regulator [Geodermatophilus marinus]|uniref:GntR family transcriptional regulator n=1 Tax=Geodermatophilus sp. LHW52908 TaxID=2303986 RepID=UPI000E3DCF3A|nr:GntR family transcriptional regulator [Geodermatophilus sp. LHW52908]RFU22063.1 GntR family transcriptional regulator [Geodermatophilus sp. LHW52908]